MAQFLPWLRVRTPDGRCSEINNCQTLGYLKKYRQSDFTVVNCPDCCPPCVGDIDDYTGVDNTPVLDRAWWASAGSPESNNAQGLFIEEIFLEPANSVRRQGESGEATVEYSPRRLEITGILYANDAAALLRLRNELSRIFTEIDPSQLYIIELLSFCPDDVPNPPVPQFNWLPDPEPALIPVTGDVCFDTDPCKRQDPGFVPNVLGAAPVGPDPYDDGIRRLLNVRFVSLDQVDDGVEGTAAPCDGERVQIVLEVLTEEIFGEGVTIECPDVTMGGIPWGDSLPDTLDEWRCRPYDFRKPKGFPIGDVCPEDPFTIRPVGLEEPRPVTVFAPAPSAVIRPAYCSPMFRQVRACLSPQLTTIDDATLTIEIYSGSEDVRNVAIKVWPAWEGWPSPETCEGEELYETIKPCLNPYMIPWIPANSTMVIDGAARQVRLSCFSSAFERADDKVDSIGTGLDFPRLRGGCFYWVYISTDCFNRPDDFRVELTFTPVTVAA